MTPAVHSTNCVSQGFGCSGAVALRTQLLPGAAVSLVAKKHQRGNTVGDGRIHVSASSWALTMLRQSSYHSPCYFGLGPEAEGEGCGRLITHRGAAYCWPSSEIITLRLAKCRNQRQVKSWGRAKGRLVVCNSVERAAFRRQQEAFWRPPLGFEYFGYTPGKLMKEYDD